MQHNDHDNSISFSYLSFSLMLAIAVLFVGLGELPLSTLNEARRALPIREMVLSGDWLIPTMNNQIYIVKPPLYYWLGAIPAIALNFVSEWVARLPSVIAGLLGVFLCYRQALRSASAWAAVFSVQILIANSGYAVHSRRAELEIMLTLFCFASLLCAWRYMEKGAARSWLYASYGCLGLAIMTKGPVSLLFVTLPIMVYAIVHHDARAKQILLNPFGWCILLLIALPWYALVTTNIGLDGWEPILKRDIIQKISGEVKSKPSYSYFQWVFAAFFPFVLLLLLKPKETLLGWWRNKEHSFWLLGFLLPLLVFTLFKEKHAKYLLPAYPCFALLLGIHLAALRENAGVHLRYLIEWTGPLLCLCYISYFSFGEARFFAERNKALPEIRQFMQQQSNLMPLFSPINLDMRAVYYIGRSVEELTNEALQQRYLINKQGLFFFETLPSGWTPPKHCQLIDIQGFIKKNRHLYIYRNGASCALD